MENATMENATMENTTGRKTLNESIITVRAKLATASLKMSGYNDRSNWHYFELSDFLPTLTALMMEENMNDRFYIKGEEAILELIKGNEKQEYTIPFVKYDTPVSSKGSKLMQDVQYLGALTTYYRRYLYVSAFGISDGDIIDSMFSEGEVKTSDDNVIKIKPLATPTQVSMLEGFYKGDNLSKLLKSQGVEKVEDISAEEASKLIALCKANHGATPSQIDYLKQVYKGNNMNKLLESLGISKIEDISREKAEDLINKVKAAQNK